MDHSDLEKRITALEADVARLKRDTREFPRSDTTDWDRVIGSFDDDPAFDEAMELGRQWRKSLDETPSRTRTRRNVRA